MVSKDPYEGLNVVDSISTRWGFDAGRQLHEEEHRLTHRLLQRREKILKSVYFAAERFLREVPDDENILLVLEHFGQATEVSRVYIFANQCTDDGTLLTSQRFEWVAPGISPQLDNPDCQQFPWIEAGLERWVQTLSSGGTIYGHVKNLSQAEQNLLAPQGIVSILVAPIFVGSGWWGFIGFDECRTEREWAPVEIEALKIAANVVGAAFERKHAEAELRKSEVQKQAILDASIDWVHQVDRDLRIVWCNRATAQGLQMPTGEIIGRSCYEVLGNRDTPCDGCPSVRAFRTGTIERSQMKYQRFRGINGPNHWDAYSVPLKDDAGEIAGCIQIARNITEQVTAIEALEESEEKIHTLTQELIKAQENERHRIACYLHDDVAQDLSSLKIGLETLCDDRRESNPQLREKIAGLSRLLQSSIAAVRNLSYDLRPPGIDQLGLNRAVFLYCEEFGRQNDLKLDFYSAGLEDVRLDFDTEINLFRLIQEGLTNIKKHARAGQVAIRLVASCPNIILRIEDDGTGFDVHARLQRLIKEKRMGLSSMEERVRLLGGKMRIRSRPGDGTRLYIEVPLKERDRDSDSAHHDRG